MTQERKVPMLQRLFTRLLTRALRTPEVQRELRQAVAAAMTEGGKAQVNLGVLGSLKPRTETEDDTVQPANSVTEEAWVEIEYRGLARPDLEKVTRISGSLQAVRDAEEVYFSATAQSQGSGTGHQ